MLEPLLGLAVALALGVYLVVTLIRPEQFLIGRSTIMTLNGWLQIGLLFLVVVLLVKPLGLFMARVFTGQRTLLSPLLQPN